MEPEEDETSKKTMDLENNLSIDAKLAVPLLEEDTGPPKLTVEAEAGSHKTNGESNEDPPNLPVESEGSSALNEIADATVTATSPKEQELESKKTESESDDEPAFKRIKPMENDEKQSQPGLKLVNLASLQDEDDPVELDNAQNEDEDEGQHVLPDFEFVSVPSLKCDSSDGYEESDPFMDVIDVTPSTSIKPSAGVVLKNPQAHGGESTTSRQQLRGNMSQCLHCKHQVPDLDAHLEMEECFKAILKCSNCQRLFDSERNFLQHFTNCAMNKITCEFCGVEFQSNLLFAYHWFHVHADLVPVGLDDCGFCNNGWCQMLVGTGKPKCMICSSYYTSRTSLIKHVYMSHLSADHQIKRIIRKRLTCSFCYETFARAGDLCTHFMNLKCKFAKCIVCGSVFKDKEKYKYHRNVCHKSDGIVIIPDKNHQCPCCGQNLYDKIKANVTTKLIPADQFTVE